jgi:hypothetical protein
MVDVKIEDRALQRALRKAPESLFREFRKAWRKHHQKFVNKMKRERLSGRPGLKAQTGTLRRGLIVKDEGTDVEGLVVASVFTGAHAFFAHVHETGMTIRAKNAPFLTFKGADGWASVPSVRIPPRLGFKTTWDRMFPGLVEETNKAIHRALAPQETTA